MIPMMIVVSVTSLRSESGGRGRRDHVAGFPSYWPGSRSGPPFGTWPPSGVDGHIDVCRGAVSRRERNSQLSTATQGRLSSFPNTMLAGVVLVVSWVDAL
jgi:hypothetical protein